MAECMHDDHFPQGVDGEKKTGPCIQHHPCPDYARSREFDVVPRRKIIGESSHAATLPVLNGLILWGLVK